MKRTIGLREQIRDASSVDEVHNLMARGGGYTDASQKTNRRWSSTARRRIAELEKVPARAK